MTIPITVIYLTLLVIRTLVYILAGFTQQDEFRAIMFILIAVVYIVCFVATLKKQKWGPFLILLFAVIDLIVAVLTGGVQGFWSGVADVALIILSIQMIKKIAND